jgi:site-specific DNA recombinase
VDPDHPRDPAGVRVEPAEAAVIQDLFARYDEPSVSLFALALHLQALGVLTPRGRRRWNPATIRGLLTNPAYTGQVYAGRTRARAPQIRRSATHPIGQPTPRAQRVPPEDWVPVATIPALIGAEQFDRVQTQLTQNRAWARRNNHAHDYLLRALVSCGGCQCSCLGRRLPPNYAYYICRAKGHPLRTCRDERCPSRYIPAEALDALVWDDLRALLAHPGSIAYALERAHGGHWLPQDLQARREQLRRGQVHLEGQIERLTQAYLAAVIALPEYQRRRRELDQKIQALAAQTQQLDTQVDPQAELAGLVTSIEV